MGAWDRQLMVWVKWINCVAFELRENVNSVTKNGSHHLVRIKADTADVSLNVFGVNRPWIRSGSVFVRIEIELLAHVARIESNQNGMNWISIRW